MRWSSNSVKSLWLGTQSENQTLPTGNISQGSPIALAVGCFTDKLISCRSLLQNLGDMVRSVDKDYFVKNVCFELKRYKKGIVIIDDLRFYNELTPLINFAKRLYIVCIDRVNTNNDNSAELKHASENYDELLKYIKRFSLKHNGVSFLELENYKTRRVANDKAVLLDFVFCIQF